MGGAQSVEGFDGDPFGYRIIDVQPSSPGAEAGLVSWFDFVVEAGGHRLVRRRRASPPAALRASSTGRDGTAADGGRGAASRCAGLTRRRHGFLQDMQDSSFINMIVESEGKPLPLKVYNAKCARLRGARHPPVHAPSAGTRSPALTLGSLLRPTPPPRGVAGAKQGMGRQGSPRCAARGRVSRVARPAAACLRGQGPPCPAARPLTRTPAPAAPEQVSQSVLTPLPTPRTKCCT